MTEKAQNILNQMPFWATHSKLLLLSIIIVILIIFIICSINIGRKSRNYPMGTYITNGIKISVIPIVFASLIWLIVLDNSDLNFQTSNGMLTQEQLRLLQTDPVKTISKEKVDLYSASSASFNDFKAQGKWSYISGNTTDATSYRYITKENAGYQIKTLKSSYANVSPDDVYINQSNNEKPQLIIEKHEYENKEVRSLLERFTLYKGTWTTYTFVVPKNSINSNYEFK